MKKILYNTFKVLICFAGLICLILIACELEHKSAKLEYVGKVILDYPYPNQGICKIVKGKRLKEILEHSLNSKLLGTMFPEFRNKKFSYKIKWEDGFFLIKMLGITWDSDAK